MTKNTFLFGLGDIGLNYDYNNNDVVTHTKALLKNNNFNLIGVFDKKKKQIKKFKDKYNVPTYEKFPPSKVLQKIECAVICVDTQFHLFFIRKLSFYKNIKVIIIEKPCGKNHKEFLEIEKICKSRGINLFVNYQRIHDKNYIKIYKNIKKLNNFSGSVYYSRGLRNNLGHVLSLLNPLGLNKIRVKILNHKKNPDFLIHFKKGYLVFLNTNSKNISNNDFIITGSKTKILTSNEMNNFKFYTLKKDQLIKENFYFEEKFQIKINNSMSQKNSLDYIHSKMEKKNHLMNVYKNVSTIIEKIKILNAKKNN